MTDREKINVLRANSTACLAISGMLLCTLILPDLVGTDDLLRYYAWSMLIAELGCLYLTSRMLTRALGGQDAAMQRILPASPMLLGALLGVGLYVLALGTDGLMVFVWQWLGADIGGALLPMEGGWRIGASILLIGLVPAFAEESLFRGVLLKAWLPLGKTKAVIRVSILFALCHCQPHFLPSLLLISWVLCEAALAADSCYAAIAAHVVYNVLSMGLAYVATLPGVEFTFGGAPLCVLALVLGVLLCLLAIRSIRRQTKKSPPPAPVVVEEEAEVPHYRPGMERASRLPMAVLYSLLVFINVMVLASSLMGPG